MHKFDNNLRVRIAPSPTGYFHFGTARTALFNWLMAKKYGGKFILRIEDTDVERSKPEYEDNIVESLEWLGIGWDEFYRQSERLEIYKNHLEKLLNDGKAFWCYHTLEELENEKQEQIKNKQAPRHVCEHKNNPPKNKPEKGIIRLNVNENSDRKICFEDIIKGKIEWEEKLIGDVSLAKDLNTPLYNFAVVIDDYEMKITHVVRGEDHISNTPKQILIYEALGFKVPDFGHLPLVLGTDRSKLSKRDAVTAISDYKKIGYLPEVLINFMVLLGWTPKQNNQENTEIISIDQIINQFEVKDIHKSGAIFDNNKLNWMNNFYIKQMTPDQFRTAIIPFVLEKINVGQIQDSFIDKIQPLVVERMEILSDIKEFDYFFKDPEYEPSLLKWKKGSEQDAKNALEKIKQIFENEIDFENFDKNLLKKRLDELSENEFKKDRGAVYWPLRVSLTGKQGSPDPIDILGVLTKNTIIDRIESALKKLSL